MGSSLDALDTPAALLRKELKKSKKLRSSQTMMMKTGTADWYLARNMLNRQNL